MAQPLERLLQRPLYVFDLPKELLYNVHLKTQTTAATPAEPPPPPTIGPSPVNGKDGPAPATSCGLCGLTFDSLQDQRAHVRSDLHGYNLKQKTRGRGPVREAEFERLVGELEESISGSESEDSGDDDEDDRAASAGPQGKESTLQALLKRQARIANGDADDAPPEDRKRKQGSGRPPVLWFGSDKLASNISLGIYRAIFSNEEQDEELHLAESLRRKQLAPTSERPAGQKLADAGEDGGVPLPISSMPSDPKTGGPHYFLCMIGGGHFAAMLVSLTPKFVRKAGLDERSASVISHKTFHRYTTRRKQGGSQSANDNSKGNAHSAGSSLRRYNEVALEADVRALLADWKPWIDTSDLLFVRATGSTNRKTLYGPYDGQVLSIKDKRLRGFPFSTRRATQSELMRAFVELTRVRVSTIDEAALACKAAEDEAISKHLQEQQKGKASTPRKPLKPSKEDEEASLHTSQLQALIRRSKAPGMLSYIQSNELSPDLKFFPLDQNHHAPTPLHLAAATNSAACIIALLVRAGSDPGVRNADGKTAFELAGDRATRDAFRLARGQVGEQKWGWDGAGVPPSLTQTEVDQRAAREKEEKAAEEKAEKDKRQAEAQKLRKEDEAKQAGMKQRQLGKGNVLGAPPMTAEERRSQDAKGMSDEMRMRLERERRARAAEERIRRMQGGG